MSILDQYKQTANTQTNAIQSFGDNLFGSKQNMTPYQPAPNMINYATGQPTYAAPSTTSVPKTTSKAATTSTTKTTQDPYSSAPLGSQQRSADLMAQAQAMLNQSQGGSTTNNLANTPISKFYNSTPTEGIGPYQDLTQRDEDQIRREVLGRYQSQIDATKASYASLMGETKRLGTGRLGESTAMQARGGLLGSDFGAAQTENVRGFNLSQEKGVLESEAMAVSNIMAQAMGDAQAEIAAKRAAKQYGYAALQEYNAGEQARKQANIKKVASAMILQGVDPRTMGSQLKELAKTYKVSEADIINAYLEEEDLRKEETTKSEWKSVGKESMLFNPETGEWVMPPGSEAGGAGQPTRYSTTKMDQTLSAAQQLLNMAQQDPQIFGRSAAVPIPSALRSDAFRNYDSALKQLKANIAFNELTQMREASKTGGALGQVSNIELGLLESSLGALDMTQSPEAVQKNLKQIISSINNFKQAVAQYGGGDMSMMEGGEDVFAEEW